MAQRKHINLIYRYNDNWIAGTYYILNIIKSLMLLDDEIKPELTILHNENAPLISVQDINYPYISFRVINTRLSFAKRLVNKLMYYVNGRRLFKLKLPKDIKENVYPLDIDIEDNGIENAYYWIPDFQERHYPEFFSKLEIRARTSMHEDILRNNSNVVFSSSNAMNDYDTFYSSNRNKKQVLRFASFMNKNFQKIERNGLLVKFGINKPFFIIPNQFWKHKNQKVVLEAITLLKGKNVDFQFVFTGKEHDYRNPGFAEQLKEFAKENQIWEDVLFLGFIDRDEQLRLMELAQAIIQPSLFEGWSTVVEDAKAINQIILVSDIPLHREQIEDYCIFFNPKAPSDLAEKITHFERYKAPLKTMDYKNDQLRFANNLLSLFS